METLEEARLMAGIEHWNACANRLYCAAFLIEATADFIESIRLLIEAEAWKITVRAADAVSPQVTIAGLPRLHRSCFKG